MKRKLQKKLHNFFLAENTKIPLPLARHFVSNKTPNLITSFQKLFAERDTKIGRFEFVAKIQRSFSASSPNNILAPEPGCWLRHSSYLSLTSEYRLAITYAQMVKKELNHLCIGYELFDLI